MEKKKLKESKQAEETKKGKLTKQAGTKKRNSETDDDGNKQRKQKRDGIIKKRETNHEANNRNHNQENTSEQATGVICDDSDDEEDICFFCSEPYQKTSTDSWIQCTLCFKWAHDDCAGVDERMMSNLSVIYAKMICCREDSESAPGLELLVVSQAN